jgi:hypothetical protein
MELISANIISKSLTLGACEQILHKTSSLIVDASALLDDSEDDLINLGLIKSSYDLYIVIVLWG